jgi:cytosine/adenosine deaminase-related metal-dependent hydrolase
MSRSRTRSRRTPFYRQLDQAIERLGGMLNAHLHLDRAETLDLHGAAGGPPLAETRLTLAGKHGLIPRLHDGAAFDAESIRSRVSACMDVMVEAGTRRGDTLCDVTTDRVGLTSFETMLEVKAAYADRIDLRVGAYSPFGFTDAEPERFALVEEAARRADFLGSLPERDDRSTYPGHIGFDAHCRRLLELCGELRKPLHLHLDQRNDPSENATERFLSVLEEVGAPDPVEGESMVWAVHVLSPAAYQEERFEALVERLVRNDVGVICCPSAALGMRQVRPLLTPTHNSIARVLELAAAGVPVRLGSDNIGDVFSPSTTADLVDEIYVLSSAVRFYDVDILAKFAAGALLGEPERERIRKHLQNDRAEVERMLKEGVLPGD